VNWGSFVFSPAILISSTNKICDRHDMTEFMLTVALNTLNPYLRKTTLKGHLLRADLCIQTCRLYYEDLIVEEFEDTKVVIRIRKSKDRQHNGQKKKNKRTNNDLQNIHMKLEIE
jgi:hypothetical protein